MVTKLGTPAITTPGQLTLRAVQSAVDNIRERLVAVEAVATASARAVATPAAAGADLSSAVLALQREVANLAAAVGAADLDDLAPASSPPRAQEDDLAPPGVSRAELALLVDRIEALELEPLR